MGQIRKINNVYYIEFYARGLLYSQVAGTNAEDAKKLLLGIEEKISAGEALTIDRHIDLQDFYERFKSDARIQFTLKSVLRYDCTIMHFSSFLRWVYPQVTQLAQLTPAIIESYKDYLIKTQKVKVVNLSILLIRDILGFGIKLGFINDNPSLHVRLLPWPRAFERKPTARYNLAKQLLLQGTGLGKLTQLLKLPDIFRAVYYANLIPVTREDVNN